MGASTGDRRVAWPHGSVAARVLIGLVVAVAAGSSACSGDDDTAPTEPVDPRAPTSVAATTVAATTVAPTTQTPTSKAPQTTVASSEAQEGTTPPTLPSSSQASAEPTSSPPSSAGPEAEEAALAAVREAHTVWIDCIANLPACDPSAFDAYYAEPALSGVKDQVAEAQTNGYVVDNADQLTFEVLQVELEAFVPYVLVCQRDGSALIERREGQPDRLIEGGYNEKIREVQLERSGDRWRVKGYATRDEVAGQVGALCA